MATPDRCQGSRGRAVKCLAIAGTASRAELAKVAATLAFTGRPRVPELARERIAAIM
jgi:hypothetical protein